VTGGKPIAIQSQSLGVRAITLVAFYDIHGRKTEVLFFYSVPDITRDIVKHCKMHIKIISCGLVWCPGQKKRRTPLSFFHGCRKRRLKD
jgi:hypothetical protein